MELTKLSRIISIYLKGKTQRVDKFDTPDKNPSMRLREEATNSFHMKMDMCARGIKVNHTSSLALSSIHYSLAFVRDIIY